MELRELEALANHLPNLNLENISSECLLRTSVSKHYYDVFHKIKCWLKNHFPNFLSDSGGATHQQIRVCFDLLYENFNDQYFKMIGLKLKVLHTLRTSADYHLEDTFGKGKLITILAEKKRIFELMEQLGTKYLTPPIVEVKII